MLAIVAEVDDRPAPTAPATAASTVRAAAEAAVARLHADASDLRGCALLGERGEPLAASGDPDRWASAAAGLLAAADAAAGRPATHAHVATEDGEAFAVRERGLAGVAVTERFALTSLVLFDLRSALRDVARAGAGVAPAPAAAAASEEGR